MADDAVFRRPARAWSFCPRTARHSARQAAVCNRHRQYRQPVLAVYVGAGERRRGECGHGLFPVPAGDDAGGDAVAERAAEPPPAGRADTGGGRRGARNPDRAFFFVDDAVGVRHVSRLLFRLPQNECSRPSGADAGFDPDSALCRRIPAVAARIVGGGVAGAALLAAAAAAGTVQRTGHVGQFEIGTASAGQPVRHVELCRTRTAVFGGGIRTAHAGGRFGLHHLRPDLDRPAAVVPKRLVGFQTA